MLTSLSLSDFAWDNLGGPPGETGARELSVVIGDLGAFVDGGVDPQEVVKGNQICVACGNLRCACNKAFLPPVMLRASARPSLLTLMLVTTDIPLLTDYTVLQLW
jgi:hypothetical protein